MRAHRSTERGDGVQPGEQPEGVPPALRPGNDSLVTRAIPQIISLVHSADVTVIVPEVNTFEQAGWWRNAGADAAWGAHFGFAYAGLPATESRST